MLHWIWEAIIGLIVGAFAKLIMPGKDPGGIFITMLLGIAGSLLAGWLGQTLGWYQPGQNAGFLMSLVGALICWESIGCSTAGRRRRKGLAAVGRVHLRNGRRRASYEGWAASP